MLYFVSISFGTNLERAIGAHRAKTPQHSEEPNPFKFSLNASNQVKVGRVRRKVGIMKYLSKWALSGSDLTAAMTDPLYYEKNSLILFLFDFMHLIIFFNEFLIDFSVFFFFSNQPIRQTTLMS